MDIRSTCKRFMDAFAQEMGRWSARVVAGGIALIAGILVTQIIR